jgi:hypothetical protein
MGAKLKLSNDHNFYALRRPITNAQRNMHFEHHATSKPEPTGFANIFDDEFVIICVYTVEDYSFWCERLNDDFDYFTRHSSLQRAKIGVVFTNKWWIQERNSAKLCSRWGW